MTAAPHGAIQRYHYSQTVPAGPRESLGNRKLESTLPFRLDPIVDDRLRSVNGDRLRLVPGDEHWVVRFIPPRQYEVHPNLLTRTRSVHDELVDFGIPLPPRAYLEVEEHPGVGRTMLVIAARIAGESLSVAIPKSQDARWAAEAVVTQALRHYAHAFVSRTPYCPDVHLRQFMWGTHLHSTAPGAWMVDLDAGAGVLPHDPDAREVALFHWWIGETASSAAEIVSLTGEPVVAYRRLLDELAEGPVFAHPSAVGRVDRMREALHAGEPFDANQEWVQPLL